MVKRIVRRSHRRRRSPRAPAHAQLAVIDPANLAQAVLIAQRTQRHYEELQAQYRTILRMAQGLGNLERLPHPDHRGDRHDAGRWPYGRPWLQGLNSGDPTGAAYWATTLPLERPSALPAQLTSAARRTLERQYATIEITDSVAMMGGHQVGALRGYHGQLQRAVQELEGDVLNGLAALPRDDRHPRQGRRRRTARPASGHGGEPAALSCARAVARAQQAAPRHRGHDDEHAARHVARRPRRERGDGRRDGDALRTWRQP